MQNVEEILRPLGQLAEIFYSQKVCAYFLSVLINNVENHMESMYRKFVIWIWTLSGFHSRLDISICSFAFFLPSSYIACAHKYQRYDEQILPSLWIRSNNTFINSFDNNSHSRGRALSLPLDRDIPLKNVRGSCFY